LTKTLRKDQKCDNIRCRDAFGKDVIALNTEVRGQPPPLPQCGNQGKGAKKS
jgi:hypothetical protein